MIEVISLGT